jgi:hypothetical protein
MPRAAALYKQACEADDAYACADLGRLLRAGKGVPKDIVRAAVLFRQACDHGVSSACEELQAPAPALYLVATARRDGTERAYLMDEKGTVWPAGPGQRFMDAQVETIGADFVTLKPESGPVQTLKLFGKGDPAAQTYDSKYDGVPLSLDLDGNLSALAAVAADASGANLVLQAGLNRTHVRIAARHAPWDALFARALADAGLGYHIQDTVIAIGAPEWLAKLSPLPRKASGQLVSLAFSHGDIRDIGRLFADISGLGVTLPAATCDGVAIFFREVPWDEALHWIIASCGWAYRIDNKTILIEAPKS